MNWQQSSHSATFSTNLEDNHFIPKGSLQEGDRFLGHSSHFWAASEISQTASIHRSVHHQPASFRIIPDNPELGTSQAQLTTDWWQWSYSIPAAQSPFNDTTGEFAGINQSGSVFFLTGALFGVPGGQSLTEPITRNITVNAGTEIFFPVVNVEWDNVQLKEFYGLPALTPSELRHLNEANMKTTTGMFLVIDGKTLFSNADWNDCRVQSFRQVTPDPKGFSYTIPGPEADKNVLNLPWSVTDNGQGLIKGGMSDGIWAALEFSPGQHTISFGGVFDYSKIRVDLDGHPETTTAKEALYQAVFEKLGTFELRVNYNIEQLGSICH